MLRFVQDNLMVAKTGIQLIVKVEAALMASVMVVEARDRAVQEQSLVVLVYPVQMVFVEAVGLLVPQGQVIPIWPAWEAVVFLFQAAVLHQVVARVPSVGRHLQHGLFPLFIMSADHLVFAQAYEAME